MSSNNMHPMQRKARKEFEESLAGNTPIRWVMVNRPKVRSVQEAVRVISRHIATYPDIAKKYNAKEMLQDELMYERQMVLSLKKNVAIKTLSEWYNRPNRPMSFRYQDIVNESIRMPSDVLEAERRTFIQKDSSNIIGEFRASIPETNDVITIDDYTQLAVANLKKRIDKLYEENSVLEMELSDSCGKLQEIRKKITEVETNIKAIEIVKTMDDNLRLGGNNSVLLGTK